MFIKILIIIFLIAMVGLFAESQIIGPLQRKTKLFPWFCTNETNLEDALVAARQNLTSDTNTTKSK